MDISFHTNFFKRKSILLVFMALFLTACGGGGDSDSDETLTIKETAIDKITAYAEDGSQPVPTLQDYLDAGVTGITSENLAELNTLVDSLGEEDVDTTAELDALTAQLGINIKPSANAGEDKTVQVNQSITLTGSGTDSDGTITDYEWKKGSTVLATTASFEYTPTAVGTDTFTFTVTDNDGDSASDTVDVVSTVAPVANQAPTVNAGSDKTVEVNQTITFTGSGEDTDGSIASYEWKKGSAVLATTASFNYTPTDVGTDTLIFTVTDNDGDSASDMVDVVVTGVPVTNQAPTADAGADKTVEVNQSITITGSGADSDGSIVIYEWKIGSTVLASTASFTYTPTTIGTDTLTLSVTDNSGATATNSIVVNVIGGTGTVTPPVITVPGDNQTTLNKISKTYTYDIYGRVIEENYGDGRYLEYTYDDSGNLINQTVIGGE